MQLGVWRFEASGAFRGLGLPCFMVFRVILLKTKLKNLEMSRV